MKKLMMVWLALLLAVLMCLAFVACTPDDPPQSILPIDPIEELPEEKGLYYEYTLSETLPMISITTDSGAAIEGSSASAEYYDCKVSVSGCEEEYELTDLQASVKVRGNATADYPKKPYRIKFAKKQGMLGLNDGAKAKNWVLLADYRDGSMLRNATAFFLGQNILESDGYYCSDFRPVEVTVNGQYNGMYLLAEQQQVNENRIAVTEPDEETDQENVNIGYMLEFDAYYYQEAPLEQFALDYGNHALYYADGTRSENSRFQRGYTVKNDIYSEVQRDYIQKVLGNLYEVVYNATAYRLHKSPAEGEPFKKVDDDGNLVDAPEITSAREAVENAIDVQSLVDMYILSEICEDMDIGWSSFILSIDRSPDATSRKKLTFEAPWDFDSALGLTVTETDSLFCVYPYRGTCEHGTPHSYDNPWMLLLSEQDWFWEEVNAKWQDMRERGVFEAAMRMIDEYSIAYEANYQKNFGKWTGILGSDFGSVTDNIVEHFDTQRKHAIYLRVWLEERCRHLDRLFADRIAE